MRKAACRACGCDRRPHSAELAELLGSKRSRVSSRVLREHFDVT
jgi:hypothetical protein